MKNNQKEPKIGGKMKKFAFKPLLNLDCKDSTNKVKFQVPLYHHSLQYNIRYPSPKSKNRFKSSGTHSAKAPKMSADDVDANFNQDLT